MAEDDETVAVTGMVSGLTVVPASLTIEMNDPKGIVLLATAVTVTEGDAVGEQYTVRLASEPTGTVTVYADAPAGTDVRVAPAMGLMFTPSNWDEPQEFTVTAVEDADSEPDMAAISHRVEGADYEGLTVTDTVAVTVTDNDTPGIHVDGVGGGAEVTEGMTIELEVKLNALPTGQRHGDADGAGGAHGGARDGLAAAHLHHRQLVDGADGDGDGRAGR